MNRSLHGYSGFDKSMPVIQRALSEVLITVVYSGERDEIGDRRRITRRLDYRGNLRPVICRMIHHVRHNIAQFIPELIACGIFV